MSRPSILSALELKIPPVPLALLFAVAMSVLAKQLPVLSFAPPGRIVVAPVLAGLGMAFAVAGIVAIRKAMTTTNPMRPEAASVLVRSGAYRFSRNPMYVGLLLALGGWAVFLAHGLGLLFLPAFVVYMNRFQIGREEQALAAKFGEDFAAYRQAVRRWL